MQWLGGLVANGSVAQSLVDTAVKRLYTTVFMLGLVDDPATQPYRQLPPSTVDSASHRALSLDAAHKGVVLLKNTGKLLPLVPGLKLAFIGPHANSTQVSAARVWTYICVIFTNATQASARVVYMNAAQASES